MVGKIKTIVEVSWEAIEKHGILVKGEQKRFDYEHDFVKEFNLRGNIVEEVYFDSNCKLLYSITKKYNVKQELVEEKCFNKDGSLRNQNVIDKKENGNEVSIFSSSDGKIIHKVETSYSNNGRLSNTVVYSYMSNRINRSKCIYDKNGNQIEMSNYNQDGSLDFKRVTVFDDFGNGIEWSHFNKEGILESKYSRKFDCMNNPIEWKELYSLDGVLSPNKSFDYNYDSNGNWIKRVDYIDNIPQAIIERQIDYYPPIRIVT